MAALHRAEQRHFWHRSRNEIIARGLTRLGVAPGSMVLELGCGSGCVSTYLASIGYRVVGVDGHRVLLSHAAAIAVGAEFWLHDLTRGVGELPKEQFDVVGMFDVLEHLDDPVGALDGAMAMSKPGGIVVGTVPSMMCLWSRVDDQAGHRTRYDVEGLRRVLETVRGADVVEVLPFHRVLVPFLFARRLVMGRCDGDELGSSGASKSSGSSKSSKSSEREHSVSRVSERNFRVPMVPINEAMLWLLRLDRVVSAWPRVRSLGGPSIWFALRCTGGGSA